MADESVVLVKEEKPEATNEPKPEETANGDDDDVIVLPPEEPVITEILDEPEQTVEGEKSESSVVNATDDDVMIQEPKIETQIVNDDDFDDPMTGSSETCQPLIVKIKEEPKDDGYEDGVNDEDPFVEVTSINEDVMLGECLYAKQDSHATCY